MIRFIAALSVNGIFGTTGANVMHRGNLTDLPVSLMIARDSGGMYTGTSPNGLQDVLQRLAASVNEEQ